MSSSTESELKIINEPDSPKAVKPQIHKKVPLTFTFSMHDIHKFNSKPNQNTTSIYPMDRSIGKKRYSTKLSIVLNLPEHLFPPQT